MTALLTRPRSIRGLIFANGNNPVAQLDEAFKAFKDKHNGHMDDVQTAIDAINARIAGNGINGIRTEETPPEPEYTRAFASLIRNGDGAVDDRAAVHRANAEGLRKQINAAMSVGSNSDGGYLAPTEWDRAIRKAQITKSPMRRLATIITTSVNAYKTLWNDGAWGSGWVGETASRPGTSTPQLQEVVYDHGEIYAFPFITQRLLDDADYPVESWLETEVGDEFARQEGIAFVSGNGVNKPRGLLTYVAGGASETTHPGGTLTVVASGVAAGVSADGLIDFVYSLPAPYRQNAKWLMNSKSAATIAKLKDGDNNYLWRETYVLGQPATLLGYAVEIDENMPDIAAGNLAIAFGDFALGYVINDRIGVRILRDPYTNKPFVGFYATKRVGGGVRDPKAIRLLKIGAN